MKLSRSLLILVILTLMGASQARRNGEPQPGRNDGPNRRWPKKLKQCKCRGNDGTNGTDGAVGPQGLPGIDGTDGATGPQGIAGINGTDGATGAQGEQGVAGPNGTQGLPGADGSDGAAGPQGPAGPTGNAGADGATGPQGPAGNNGADGATGSQGPTGPRGSTGAAGPTGPQGPPGSSEIVGASDLFCSRWVQIGSYTGALPPNLSQFPVQKGLWMFRNAVNDFLIIKDYGAKARGLSNPHVWASSSNKVYCSIDGVTARDVSTFQMTGGSCTPDLVGLHRCGVGSGWILWHGGVTQSWTNPQTHPCNVQSSYTHRLNRLFYCANGNV